MKNKILSFALPLLLALSPVAAPAARLLWVDVRGSATVEDGDTNPTVGEYRSSGTGHSVNAFRVSVPDAEASGGTNRLVFAYEENGSMVVGGSEPVVRSLDFANGGALWAPLDLAAYADRNLVVTMELGYVDPANASSFEKLAFATEHLGSLLDAPHVSIQSDLNPPALTPWAPETFTVTVPWAIAYDLAGGTNNPANPEFYTEGQLPIALLPAGREGYTFAGWTNELGAVVEEIAAGSTGDRSFGATWLENVEPPAGASFIYDGTAKTGVPSGAGYSVTGDATATEPGQYTVTLSLESGYIWSDGTTADKTVTWSIAPAVAMTLSVPDETTGVVTTNYFATLQEAIDATASSDPIATNVVLRGDVEETVVVTNSVAIDLAGHELDGDVTNAVPAVIGTSVPGGGITGDIVSEGDSARLVIEGGEFDGELSAPDGGSISITGGHFAKDPSDYVADGYYAAGDDTNGYDVLPCRSILDTTIAVAAAEYTGVSQVPAVTVETNGVALVPGTDFTVSYATNDLVNADTYAIVVNGIGAWKDSVPTNFVITTKSVTITVADATKVYGEADPAFTGAVVGLVGENDLGTVAYSRTGSDEDVGTYADVLTASYTANANYAVTVVPADFTIKPAAMTISVTGYTGTYDGASHAASATTVPDNATVTWSTDGGATWSDTAPAILNAGTNEVIAQAVLANYATVTSEVAKLIVTPKPATITVEASEKVYGENDPAFTGTVEGLVADGDLGEVTYSRTNADVNDVGTYSGVLTASYTANANYAVTVVPADFTIKPAAMTITVAGYEGVYDGASHDATATTQPAGATVTWSTDGGATWSADVPAILNAGTNEVIAQAVLANYATVTSEVAKLIVKPKDVTVKANDQLVTYGDAEAPLTVTVSGMLEGESTNLLSWTVSREAGNDVGSYAITVTGDESQGNYAVAFVGGAYTIAPAGTMALQASDWIGAYDGTAHSNAVQVVPAEGTTILYSADDGETWTLEAPSIVNVGELPVLVQATNANYNAVSTNVLLSVTNRPVVVTAGSASKNYDGTALVEDGYTAAGLAEGDTIAVATVSGSQTNVGVSSNEVSVTSITNALGADVTSNYSITEVDGELKVTKASISITVAGTPSTSVYNGENQTTNVAWTATSESALFDESKVRYSGAATVAGTPVGDYPYGLVNTQFAYDDANIDATFNVTDAAFAITKAEIAITVAGTASTAVYTGAEQTTNVAYTATSESALFDKSKVQYSGAATVSGTTVGGYPYGLANNQFAYDDANVDATFNVTDAAFTITKAEIAITVTGTASSAVYTGAEQTTNVAYVATSESALFDKSKVQYSGAATVSGTTVGGYPYGLANNQFAYDDANVDATFNVTDAAFTITKAEITITVAGTASSAVYTGAEQTTNVAYTVTSESALFDKSKVRYSGAATVSGTTVGSYPYGMVNTQFAYDDANVDATFNVTDAAFTITKAEITITVAGTASSAVYTGAEQTTNVAYTVTSESALFNESKVRYSGAATVSGTTVGSYPYGLVNTQFAYDDANIDATFNVTDAAFAITKAEITITVAGTASSAVYNGENQTTNVAYVATSESSLFDETKVVYDGEPTVTGKDVKSYAYGLAESQFSYGDENVTARFTVEDSAFTIAKAEVTIAVASSSKTFGTEDPAFTGTVEGLVADGDLGEITYSRTNADEDVGTYAGVLTASYTANANYSVTVVPGDFEITAAAAMVITVADGGVATTNYYATLAGAITNAPADATVQLLADVAEPAVDIDTPITLDLNGHFWAVEPAEGETDPGTITISAAVELVNTSESDPSIVSSAGPVVSVVAGGSLTVGDNAGVKYTGDQTSGAGVSVAEGGILVVDGGMVGIEVVSSGRVQVSDGNVVGNIAATGANATVAISGGLVGGSVVVAEGADVAVSGGVICDGASASGEGSTIDISGGVIDDGGVSVSGGATAAISGRPADTIVNGELVGTPETLVVTGGHFEKNPEEYVDTADYRVDGYEGPGYDVTPRKTIEGAEVTIAQGLVYTGEAQYGVIVIAVDGADLTLEDDYTVVYDDNVNAGTVTATISGTNDWKGTIVTNFIIAKRPLGLVWSGTNLVYTGEAQAPTAEATGIVAGDDVSVVVSGAQTQPGTYTATASLSGAEAGNYALPDPATTEFTITAVYIAQVGETKYFAIADAITAAGGLVAEPEVITLLTNADASVTLETPAQRLRVALDGHELTVLSGDPIRYEVATNVEDSVTVYALEQLKADGLMIVRFDYEAAKLAYDMGTAENMLKMYPTNEPIWCTVATATELRATDWTAVESSRAWKENLVPPASATDADLEWLENLDTESSPIRFWRIAVTPFKLTPNETIEFKPGSLAPEPDGD